MHLFFYVRGIYQQVELFKSMAQGLFWKWKRINLKTKKEETILVQGALRPSVLGAWEYIFPEECLAEVLTVFSIKKENDYAIPKARMIMLRALFKAKKIPKKIIEEAKKIPESIIIKDSWRGLSHIKISGVAVHIIGIKKDERRDMDFGIQGKYNQEAL